MHNQTLPTPKLLPGDVVHEPLYCADRPGRQVRIIQAPVWGSLVRDGFPVWVLYVTGTDEHTGQEVRWTASPWRSWPVLRTTGTRADLVSDYAFEDGRWIARQLDAVAA
jgi:hypothetical protein